MLGNSRLEVRILAALLLTACGATANGTQAATCTPRPEPPAPSAVSAPVSATADRGRVDPGGAVTFTETVAGPATLHPLDCNDFHLNVWESNQDSIYSTTAPIIENAASCPEIQVASGSSNQYTITWPVDPTLPGGAYNAELTLADAPTITLTIIVGTVPKSC